jgi:hypothetical protein
MRGRRILLWAINMRAPKFKVGDWVKFVGGFDEGKTTTITAVYLDTGVYYYEGFYCGQLVGGTDEQTEKYR